MSDTQQIRKQDFEFWLSEFNESYSSDFFSGCKLSYDDNICEKMNNAYWELIKTVKGFMFNPQKKVNCFKIIAGIQSIILYYQPFQSPINSSDLSIKKGRNRINAEFAWSVSLKILFSFYEKEIISNISSIEIFLDSKEFIELREFHLTWCENVDFINNQDGNIHSYFILAQFWQTLYYWLIEFLKKS